MQSDNRIDFAARLRLRETSPASLSRVRPRDGSTCSRKFFGDYMFNNKVLLITGGTGPFGGAVLDRLLPTIREIRIFSRDKKSRTTCLDIEGMKRLLLKLDFIQKVNRAESALIEA